LHHADGDIGTDGEPATLRGAARRSFGSIWARLLILVLVTVLPILGFAALLVFNSVGGQRAAIFDQLQLTARALGLAVDRELGIEGAILATLRQSGAVETQDWEALRQYTDALIPIFPWLRIAVIAPSGQLVFSSAQPRGTALPMAVGMEPLKRSIETGNVEISGLITSAISGTHAISTYFPIVKDGAIVAVLAVSCDATRFQAIIEEQRLSSFMTASIIDGHNHLVSTAPDPEKYIGREAPAPLFDQARHTTEGLIEMDGPDRQPARIAYSRIKAADWIVTVGIEEAALSDSVYDPMMSMLSGGAALLGLSIIAALSYSRRIAQETTGLSKRASALAGGEEPQPHAFEIRELQNVADALATAGGSISRYRREQQAMLDLLEQRVEERTVELRESEKLYRMLAENSVDVIVTGGFDGVRRYASPSCAWMFGYSVDELVGGSWLDIVHPDDMPMVEQALSDLERTGEDQACTYRIRRKDGEYIWCEVMFRLLPGEDGEASGEYLATVRDITIRKTAEEMAFNAMAVATQANQAKSLFLASMSHELRTPLNAIIGFSEMLSQEFTGPLNERQAEYVGYVLRSGKTLLTLVKDVLDLSSIDSAPLPVVIEPVALAPVLDELVSMMRLPAAEKSITFSVERPAAEAPPVKADRRRLLQVLINLCSNAIKYNRPGGSVTVEIYYDEPGWICISVLDTGIGIRDDQHDAVFEPFNRLGAEGGAIEGSGIGLTISRRLVAAMMGRLELESELGVGSRFTIVLPLVQNG